MTERTFIYETEDKYDLENELEVYLQFFTDWCHKRGTYCVKCRKKIKNLDSKIFKTKNNRLIMQSKCTVCGIKKSRFLEEKEVKGLLSNFGIKTPLSKISLLIVLFWVYKSEWYCEQLVIGRW